MKKRDIKKSLVDAKDMIKSVTYLYFEKVLKDYICVDYVFNCYLYSNHKPKPNITIVYEKYNVRIDSKKLDIEVTKDTPEIILDDALAIQEEIKKFESNWLV